MQRNEMIESRKGRLARLVKLGFADLREYRDYIWINVDRGFEDIREAPLGGSASYGNFEYVNGYGIGNAAVLCLNDIAENYNDVADGYKDLYLFPRHTCGSDYSGSTVERSNYRVLLEEYRDLAVDVYGGHGTYAVAFSVKTLLTDSGDPDTEDRKDQLLDALECLEDSPLLSDDDLMHLEMEQQREAWTSWASRDFVQALEKRFEVELDGYTDDDLWALFCDVADEANEYWECGEGWSMWIDVEAVAGHVEDYDIADWIVEGDDE